MYHCGHSLAFPKPLIQMSKPHLQCVSFWLIGYLIVYVVEKHAGIQWVVLNELNWNLVAIFASLETHFVQLKLQLHCDYVSFLEFKALNSWINTFILLLCSAEECDQIPPFELIMYPPCPTEPNENP